MPWHPGMYMLTQQTLESSRKTAETISRMRKQNDKPGLQIDDKVKATVPTIIETPVEVEAKQHAFRRVISSIIKHIHSA